MRKAPRLEKSDWERAAVEALAKGGVTAVAVEPLAAQLEVTKGSFYWHFSDREALIAAALARWEREETIEAMALLSRISDPRQRMTQVLRSGFVGRLGGSVDAALLADAADPIVAPVLQRVTAARLRYTTTAFRALGFRGRAASQRALITYAAYVGHFALQRAAPRLLPRGTAAASYVEHVVATLLARP
ncbi:MAG: TetR-type regulator [Myxococcales bacterium]|nr:TetR-type regulator [Myxococcales bacterium]